MKQSAIALALGLGLACTNVAEPFPGLHLAAAAAPVGHASPTLIVAGNVLVAEGFHPASGGRITTLSLADEIAPTPVDTEDMAGIGRGMLDGNLLYFPRRTFPNGTKGDSTNAPSFVSYALAPSGALTLVHQYRVAADPYLVYARGDYAYVFDGNTRQMLVAKLSGLPSDIVVTPPIVRRITLPATPMAMDVSNGMAYLALGDAGVGIVDISVPETAHLVNTVQVASGSAVSDVQVRGTRLYAHGGLRVSVLDVTTPSAAVVSGTTLLGSLDDGPELVGAMGFDGNYLYIADSFGALWIVDVSDPARPRKAQVMALPRQSVPLTVAMHGGAIYVGAANGGVLVVQR